MKKIEILILLILTTPSLLTSSKKAFVTEDLFPWEEDIFGYDQDDPISEDELFNDKKKYVIWLVTPRLASTNATNLPNLQTR